MFQRTMIIIKVLITTVITDAFVSDTQNNKYYAIINLAFER